MEVPTSVQRATAGSSYATGCMLAAIVICFPLALYFGFFGILLIDAFVLETSYFSPENVSQEVIYGIEVIYAPLIVLVRWARGM